MRYDIQSIVNLQKNLKNDKADEDMIYQELGLLMEEFAILQVAFLILKDRSPEQLQRIFHGREDLKIILDSISICDKMCLSDKTDRVPS